MRTLLDRLWQAVILPLCTLNRIQFSAPWSPAPRRCGGRAL